MSLRPLFLLFAFVTPLFAQTEGHRFEKDVAAFEAAAAKTPPPQNALLFIGDSTFTKWKSIHEDLPEYQVINYGFGGSETSDLLYFADRLIFPIQPRLIVVQEGGNDLHGGKTPAQFAETMKALVEKIRAKLPEVPIVLCSITPNPARWGEAAARREANELTKAFAAAQHNVQFVSLWDQFLGSDGQPRPELYVDDRLHPSHEGYLLRVSILKPYLGAPDRK